MAVKQTWTVTKDNERVLQRAEMRMIGWMCDVTVYNRHVSHIIS